MNKRLNDIYSKLGANERALVDNIKFNALKRIVVVLIGIKLKLQWSGWLQYLIPVPIIILLLLISLTAYLTGVSYAGLAFLIIGALLSAKVVFDIVTVKIKIRFPESKPKRLDHKSIFDLMLLRHSCRSYQNKKLTESDFNELIESVKKNLKDSKFSSEPIRFEYISAPVTVWPVVNATEFLIAIAPKEYNRLAVLDVGRTLQKIVVDATRMGIGTCWIGPGADHKSITLQLGERFNPDKENIICISALGYESKYKPLFISVFNRMMHKRLPIESLFFTNYKLDEPIDINQSPYNTFQQTFEACQWAPSSYNGQTTRAIVSLDNDKIKRIDFLASTSSRYYAAVASGIWCANWEMGCNALNMKGNFVRLPEVEITILQNSKGLPVYDMSWVLTESIEQTK